MRKTDRNDLALTRVPGLKVPHGPIGPRRAAQVIGQDAPICPRPGLPGPPVGGIAHRITS